jgi:hypothetical protein
MAKLPGKLPFLFFFKFELVGPNKLDLGSDIFFYYFGEITGEVFF